MKRLRFPVDSMRDAVLTVSPKMQYRGFFEPMTPATTEPEQERRDDSSVAEKKHLTLGDLARRLETKFKTQYIQEQQH
jgi:hypothetical protein